MQRERYLVTLCQGGELVADGLAYAHNSGVRKSESLAREYAREHGVVLHGSKPIRDEHGYTRWWRSVDGIHELTAFVAKDN